MNAPLRLIHRTEVLQQLLTAIAAVPAGVRLRIPQLRDILVSQADIIAGIETLIIAGELDAQTLRPPPVAEPHPSQPRSGAGDPFSRPVTGAKLADALGAYVERHDLSLWRVSVHLFGGRNSVSRLRGISRPRPATIAKVREFLDAPPPRDMARQRGGGAHFAEVGVSGADLAAELDALISRHGLSKAAVGRHLYNTSSGVELLRKSHPHAATVAKVRALIEDPPIAKLRSRVAAPNRSKPARAAPAGKREPDGGGVSTPAAVPAPEPDPPPQPPAIGPDSTWLKPAEIAWCEQCEQRVSGTKAAACTSPWCKLKGAGDDQQRQVA
jgi:hypothetical protein